MDLAESIGYLRHHLSHAGRTDPLIADDAAARLHRYANGLPWALNNAAAAALMAAAADSKSLVDDACAKKAIAELTRMTPTDRHPPWDRRRGRVTSQPCRTRPRPNLPTRCHPNLPATTHTSPGQPAPRFSSSSDPRKCQKTPVSAPRQPCTPSRFRFFGGGLS